MGTIPPSPFLSLPLEDVDKRLGQAKMVRVGEPPFLFASLHREEGQKRMGQARRVKVGAEVVTLTPKEKGREGEQGTCQAQSDPSFRRWLPLIPKEKHLITAITWVATLAFKRSMRTWPHPLLLCKKMVGVPPPS